MFSREGYVPISKLWRDFEQTMGAWCLKSAQSIYRSKTFQPREAFGTSLDLCEDIFLHLLDDYGLSLVPASGDVINVSPTLPKSAARFLEKMSVLESSIVADCPDQAGAKSEWLTSMGSNQFRRAFNGTFSPEDTSPRSNLDWDERLGAAAFHTLPILFERSSFVVARQLPPWANDLIEDAYVRHVWGNVAGYSICLTAKEGTRFCRAMSPKVALPVLGALVPSFDVQIGVGPEAGRPRILEDVRDALRTLDLLDSDLRWKQKQAAVEAVLGRAVSETTLRRAAQHAKGDRSVS
ncbi:hypothetical protein [Palleronia pelagia]|uniref:Uncharacterized protein n=1 Tax=Palleronia pelagia TaxID=387096 RepID=A0A1H8K9U8_9RHOB|nr:hypothetical protein [Palleronia pelagia]SEN89779.1 hypothetical protein SAMN04488011_107166 [Palleronia pelagia]